MIVTNQFGKPFDRIVFWEPSASPHKIGFVNALQRDNPSIEFEIVADRAISKDRMDLGWTVENDDLKLTVRPTADLIASIGTSKPESTLHVFSGFRHFETLELGLKHVRRVGSRFAIMSEPRVREGPKGLLRTFQSRLTERGLANEVEAVLAIGANGPKWFTSIGYPTPKIFSFAYFVDVQGKLGSSGAINSDGLLRIGYVGRLTEKKGVHILLSAIAELDVPYQLTLVGTGSEEAILKKMARDKEVCCEFLPPMRMSDVSSLMATFDALVLASTTEDDGWGVVVSEALQAGTPVIVSNKAGSSLVVRSKNVGTVVRSGCVKDLVQALRDLSRNKTSIDRRGLAIWARTVLGTRAGANYFMEVVHWIEQGGAGRNVKTPDQLELRVTKSLEAVGLLH